jgi:hypothetical protein
MIRTLQGHDQALGQLWGKLTKISYALGVNLW